MTDVTPPPVTSTACEAKHHHSCRWATCDCICHLYSPPRQPDPVRDAMVVLAAVWALVLIAVVIVPWLVS